MPRFFYIFLILLLPCSIVAQTYNFQTLSLEDGLPQAEVSCVKEDSRGLLWIGTQGGGLACYDGINFKVYDETSGLAGNIVTCLEEDANGNIWIGSTYGGLSRFDGKSFTTFTKENGLIAGPVRSICTDKKNRVLVATPGGLSCIEGKTISEIKQDIFAKKEIKNILRDNQDMLWFLAGKELFLYNGNEWTNINTRFKITPSINCITKDKSGNLWMFVEKEGLFILSKKNKDAYQMIPYLKNDKLKDYAVTHIIFDSRNNLWLSTDKNGLYKVEDDIVRFERKNGFKANQIISACSDRSGNLWFGTDGSGLLKYNPSPFIYYDNIEGLDAGNIFGIDTDEEGNLWASPNGNEVLCYNNGNIKRYNESNGLATENIRFVKIYDGTAWIGGNNGLFFIKNNKVQKFSLLPAGCSARSFLIDKKGNTWIGTNGQGLYCISGGRITHYDDRHGITHNYIHTLYEDKNGIIWIGTGNGLNSFDNGKFNNYLEEQAFCNKYIGSITEDNNGNMWFGTDRCVVCYDRHTFRSYNQADGLASSTIYSLITDAKGNVWVGTNRGVDRLTLSERSTIVKIKNFSYQEGFRGIECNSRAAAKDKDGNLYFATIKGIIKYLPEKEILNEIKPILHITGIDMFSNPFDFEKNNFNVKGWFHLPHEPVFKYNQNYLTFNFIGINMASPQKTKYQYLLDGFGEDWVNTKENHVTYTNLKPGNYVFKVKSFAGNSSDYVLLEYPFAIATPFWQSAWFYFLAVILLFLGIYWLIQYRTRRMGLLNKKLENYVDIRTAEISKQKQEIEYLFKEVHHRVKNNLQVINSLLNLQKSYIQDKKMLEIFQDCQNRIYTMSVIHEKLYENNALSSVNFNDYIRNLIRKLVEAYHLDYPVKYHVDTDIDKMDLDTMIPIGLLINEIISNSLKYAFTKDDNNVITFKMKKTGEASYNILIGDNGKGNPENLDSEHATFGLELIKMLVEQLHGKIKRLESKGTLYEINFTEIR